MLHQTFVYHILEMTTRNKIWSISSCGKLLKTVGNCRKRPYLCTGFRYWFQLFFIGFQNLPQNIWSCQKSLNTAQNCENAMYGWKSPDGHNFVLEWDIDFNFFCLIPVQLTTKLLSLPDIADYRWKLPDTAKNHQKWP